MAEISNSKILDTTGIQNTADACVVIVRTEWNAKIVDALEAGCLKTLAQHSVKKIKIINVPGAFEIGFAIKKYWTTHFDQPDKPDVFIAMGCVLRGDTPHFDYVCKAVTDAIVHLNLTLPVPTIFAVLTVDNQQQADERIGGKHGHKGEEAAITALKMINI